MRTLIRLTPDFICDPEQVVMVTKGKPRWDPNDKSGTVRNSPWTWILVQGEFRGVALKLETVCERLNLKIKDWAAEYSGECASCGKALHPEDDLVCGECSSELGSRISP